MQRSSYCKQIILFSILLITPSLAQTSDSISAKNKELSKIKKEITDLENQLKAKNQKEKESLQTLENISQQNLLLNKLINKLLAEEKDKEATIKQIEDEIDNVENKITKLKEKYAMYIVWIYKNRGLSLWRFILDSDSFNQAIKRYRYLKYVSDNNEKILKDLKENKVRFSQLRNNLENEREVKARLAKQKISEQDALEKKETEKKNLLQVLKKDQKMISQEISVKRQAEIAIKNMIAKLIEIDRQRKAQMHERKATNKNNAAFKKNVQFFDYNTFQNFEELKGKLGWPINEGSIYRQFGENKNERLNTVTLNYGIDIAVKGEQKVLSVAEGVVSAIDFIPGYGSIVIITHRDDYRTVYGHVSNIMVQEGDKINGGNPIGKVEESLEGKILHFEIWNERNYQNPELWLARK